MKRALISLLFILLAVPAMATMTQQDLRYGSMHVLELTCTSSAAGAFTAATTQKIDGIILFVETDPDGTSAPTDNYDIVLTNKNGRNICGDTGTGGSPNQDGVLSNRDTANTEGTMFLQNGNYTAIPNEGPLTVNIANMGNSKITKIRIYYYSE